MVQEVNDSLTFSQAMACVNRDQLLQAKNLYPWIAIKSRKFSPLGKKPICLWCIGKKIKSSWFSWMIYVQTCDKGFHTKRRQCLLRNWRSSFLKGFIMNTHPLRSSFSFRSTSNGWENDFPKWWIKRRSVHATISRIQGQR